jgi:RNA-splicing ligase RtcB
VTCVTDVASRLGYHLPETKEGIYIMSSATNTAETNRHMHDSPAREFTQDQLEQVTGGTTPSIPIPPPAPHAYAKRAGNSTVQSDVNPQ